MKKIEYTSYKNMFLKQSIILKPMHGLKSFKLLIAALLVVGIYFSSCEKVLDVNDDPNSTSEVNPDLLMTYVLANYANNFLEIGPPMMYWSQHWAAGNNNAGVFSNPERYIISTTTVDNTWFLYYARGQKNLALAQDIAEADGNTNAQAICKLVSALLYYHTTVMWEDIPYKQAVNYEEYDEPLFDAQDSVLVGIANQIDEAKALINYDANAQGLYTLIYGDGATPAAVEDTATISETGQKDNMLNWEKFANSLKLRVLVMLTSRDENYATLLADHIVQSGNKLILDNTENCLFPYFDESGNRNPFYKLWESYSSGIPSFFYPSKILTDDMNMDADPRMGVWFLPAAGISQYIGVKPGEAIGPTNAVISHYVIQPNTPVQLLTASETNLFLAEAYARGWVGAENLIMAKTYYEEGIRQSMSFYNISNQTISEYLDRIKDISKVTPEIAIFDIHRQQYRETFFKPHEGWVQVRRTGYPDIKPPTGALLTDVIRRWPMSTDEILSNSNAPAEKPLHQKMWIDYTEPVDTTNSSN